MIILYNTITLNKIYNIFIRFDTENQISKFHIMNEEGVEILMAMTVVT